MDTLCDDLLTIISNFLDAGECCLFNLNLEVLSIEEAVRTKNIKFTTFYIKTNLLKLIEHATYHGELTFIAFISKLETLNQMLLIINGICPRYYHEGFLDPTPELEQQIKAVLYGLVRKNDISGIACLAGWDELGFDDSELMTDLMVVAINHKNYDVISYLTSTGPAPQNWAPPDWDLKKILKANYDGDTSLLDHVVTSLILENTDIDWMEPWQYNYFEDWHLGLNCMVEKGDEKCAQYFQSKLINNQNSNEHTPRRPQWLNY